MVLQKCVFIFLVFSSISGVDVNHRHNTGILPGSIECKSRLHQMYCQIKCGMKPALCINGECHCVSIAPVQKKNPTKLVVNFDEIYNRIKPKYITKDIDNNMGASDTYYSIGPEIPHLELESLYAMRPTVRHHIAHFCPNLDVARKCIRKCMELGKPAFCGKDHVCYCGHKYTDTGKDDGGDTNQMYAQFKDLYTKYFGPNYVKKTFEVDVK